MAPLLGDLVQSLRQVIGHLRANGEPSGIRTEYFGAIYFNSSPSPTVGPMEARECGRAACS
jgi:hypothetical protein